MKRQHVMYGINIIMYKELLTVLFIDMVVDMFQWVIGSVGLVIYLKYI